MSEFKPGLEGVVAFETEIAEPDRDGGALRYRGVDIEDLVGRVPFENVWGLLVDDAPEPGLEPAARYARPRPDGRRAGRSPGRRRPPLRRVGPPQADRHLGRARRAPTSRALSATMISVVAQSARVADGETAAVDPELVASGATAATRFLLEWRGEADPKHVQAIDTYWICTAEHGLNASTFAARVVASTGADCGAALSSAAVGGRHAISLRSGCFCNPGAGEVAFTISRETLVGGEFGEGMTIDDYVEAIGLPSGGAVRASLGLASNLDDIERFTAFAREFVDLPAVPDDLPARTGC